MESEFRLNERIKERMRQKGWQAADLVRESGVAKGYLWEILQGKASKPSAQTLYQIASALGTTVADLLGKTSETRQPDLEHLPEALEAFASEADLPDEDIRMLAAIRFRGQQPKSKEDWRFLWESISRSVRN